jgi:DNA polymerase-4
MPENLPQNPPALRWLYVDFNSYFASVEQQLDPRLRGRPVIVVPVQSDATCAIAASYEAKAYGIKTNTPVYEARRLCPDIIAVVGQHAKYVAFHNRILTEIDRHIPVTKACSIDEMACRLMRNEAGVTAATEIARRIKIGLRDNIGAYIKCSIGIAPSKYLAKVATDMQKPDGLTILLPEELPHRLLSLKLRDLPGVGPRMELRLNRAGIYTMAQLLTLQAKHMRAIWGNVWGEKLWLNLRGYDVPEEETGDRKTIGHSHVLSPELRPRAEAERVAARLMQKCASRLRRYELETAGFALSLRIENGPRLATGVTFPRTADSFLLLENLNKAWNYLLSGQAAQTRIKKISVTLYNLADPTTAQRDLFDAPAAAPEQRRPAATEKLLHDIDRLNQKFGRDTITIGALPPRKAGDLGTKVAFTRIPDGAEFRE